MHAQRTEAEIARFQGKRVRVVGTVRARTPEAMAGSDVVQTMIGPCVTNIESIELAT